MYHVWINQPCLYTPSILNGWGGMLLCSGLRLLCSEERVKEREREHDKGRRGGGPGEKPCSESEGVEGGVGMPVDADEIFSENTPLALSSPNSIADSFIYWGSCGSRNSFAASWRSTAAWKPFLDGSNQKTAMRDYKTTGHLSKASANTESSKPAY